MTRIALVLGAGGVTGGAFQAGVLSALEEGTGWDPRSAEVVVGTSAGSITGAALRAGLSARDLAARSVGSALSAEGAALMEAAGLSGELPAFERNPSQGWRFSPAAPQVLLAATLRPWAVRPTAVLAGLMPAGAISTSVISEGIQALLGDAWPQKALWVTAVRLDDGRLAVFGRREDRHEGQVRVSKGAEVRPADAVAASCAIPGWFAPVVIDGARYVDGGAHSLTNLGEVSSASIDLAVVVAPLGRAGWRGYSGATRRAARLQLLAEAQRLRRRGIRVVDFQPTREDQLAMGRNPMDLSRRSATVHHARASTLARLRRDDAREFLEMLGSAGPSRLRR